MPDLHHRYAPSSMKNRAICPGWAGDDDSDKTHADRGTRMHLAVEEASPDKLTDAIEQADVKACLHVTNRLEIGATAVYKEHRLSILNNLTFGTADRIILHKRKARVLDYKFGQHAVDDAEHNLQGWCYALGVFAEFPVDSVEVWFLQPRLDSISRFTFKRADVPRLEFAIRTIIARCEQYETTLDETMLRPDAANCLYCGRIGTCPRAQRFALDVANKYEPLDAATLEVHSSQITDPAKMARLYAASRVLEKLCDSVKKHALALALELGGTLNDENGNPVYEVSERAGTRSLKTGPALEILSKYLDDRELLSVADISLSAALKLIGDKAPRGQKAKMIGAVEQELSSNQAVTSGEGSRYLKKAKNA